MTPKQQIFVQEYLIELNATAAAKNAGYKNSTARAAWRLLKRPDIVAAIAAGREERALRTRITADRVLLEYARIAFADMRNLATWDDKDGIKLRPHQSVSDDDAAAIAEISRHGGRLRLYDKRPALEALARHLGMFDAQNRPLTADYSSEATRHARAVLKARIEQIIGDRESGKGSTLFDGSTNAPIAPAIPASSSGSE